jgi:hypothetical protein
MKSEYRGSILQVRAVEDSIRATKKYTKGALSMLGRQQQMVPIQGAEFPSRVLTEYYEVYPDMELSWDMAASDAWAWVWGDTIHIDVRFQYDYRQDKAKMIVFGGSKAIHELSSGIPGFKEALKIVTEEHVEPRHLPQEQAAAVVDDTSGGRNCAVANSQQIPNGPVYK